MSDSLNGGPRPPDGDWLGTPFLTFKREGAFAICTLDRPEARNAMTPAMYFGIRYAISRVNADPDLAGLLITGTGDVFAPGGDLGQEPAEQRQPRDARRHREKSDEDGGSDARADARGQRPEPTVDVHETQPSIRPGGAGRRSHNLHDTPASVVAHELRLAPQVRRGDASAETRTRQAEKLGVARTACVQAIHVAQDLRPGEDRAAWRPNIR